MSYRDSYLSLDPAYRDSHGLPLLRLTFDWHDNEYKIAAYSVAKMEEIVRVMKPERYATLNFKPGNHYDLGSNPQNSVINRYSQSWGVSNLFVFGAPAFPQNIGYNPTGLLAGLAYFWAAAIRDSYLKSPGPLVPS
jgi:gluconate 2-dehydrogenase alpha chain